MHGLNVVKALHRYRMCLQSGTALYRAATHRGAHLRGPRRAVYEHQSPTMGRSDNGMIRAGVVLVPRPIAVLHSPRRPLARPQARRVGAVVHHECHAAGMHVGVERVHGLDDGLRMGFGGKRAAEHELMDLHARACRG